MQQVHIFLFGKFAVEQDGQAVQGCEVCKVQELLCYLLLHRGRPHPRETIASLLWGEQCTTARSKAYLRKALWQLQRALHDAHLTGKEEVLDVEPEWVKLTMREALWLDVARFEAAYQAVRGRDGEHLGPEQAAALEQILPLYRGSLLEGWYQDWCLFERERYEQMYLSLLDKLLGFCEAHGRYEAGLDYGRRILQVDRAREQTHRRLMRLRYLAGDRTGALRQFQQCAAVLHDELDVAPSERTRRLYHHIRNDAGDLALRAPSTPPGQAMRDEAHLLQDQLDHIGYLQQTLADVQDQIRRELEAVRLALRRLQK